MRKKVQQLNEIVIQIFGILLNTLPYFALCYIPVWNCLRVNKKIVMWLMLVVSFVQAVSIILIMNFVQNWDKYRLPYNLIFIIIYAAIYIFTVSCKPSKLLFVLFIIKCYSDSLVYMAKFLEINIFGYSGISSFELGFNCIHLALLVLTIIPMMLLLSKKVRIVIDSDASAWKIIWLIPAIIFGMDLAFASQDLANIKQWQYALFDSLTLVGSYIIYYVTIEMLIKTKINAELEERANQAENQLSMQINQYQRLSEYIDYSRKVNHDIRHHLIILHELASEGKMQPVREYLSKAAKLIPQLSNEVLCSNFAINALLCYYKNICIMENIDFNCFAAISNDLGIPDTLLCVIFGNCLENAAEACKRIEKSEKFIKIAAEIRGKSLIITMDNSFNGIVMKKDDKFYSSKRKDEEGVGISSIRTVVQKYKGTANFYKEGKVFKTDIILNLPD